MWLVQHLLFGFQSILKLEFVGIEFLLQFINVIVFSSFYAGNLMYYSSILKAEKVTIDLFENFHKQSFRNRCSIASPNGILDLIIPINRKSKSIIKEVKIDDSKLRKFIGVTRKFLGRHHILSFMKMDSIPYFQKIVIIYLSLINLFFKKFKSSKTK